MNGGQLDVQWGTDVQLAPILLKEPPVPEAMDMALSLLPLLSQLGECPAQLRTADYFYAFAKRALALEGSRVLRITVIREPNY